MRLPYFPIAVGIAWLCLACGGGESADSAPDVVLPGEDDSIADSATPDSSVAEPDQSPEPDARVEPVPPPRLKLGPTWLSRPMGLAFHPDREGELWVASAGDGAFVVAQGLAEGPYQVRKIYDYHRRFAHGLAGMAFAGSGHVVSCAETDGGGGGLRAPDSLVGPAIWPGEPTELFESVSFSPRGGWLERMRTTPMCTGIAAGNGGFFLINGARRSLDYVHFGQLGSGPPQDGTKIRYFDGALAPEPELPSGIAFRESDGTVFVSNPGDGTVVDAAILSGAQLAPIFVNPDTGTEFFNAKGTTLRVLIPAGTGGMVKPTGLVLWNDEIVVCDHATGHLRRYSAEGTSLGAHDTGRGPGALGGLAVGPANSLWFTDVVRHEVDWVDEADLDWSGGAQ